MGCLAAITRFREVLSLCNGEGWFRDKRPMPVVALFVVVWIPVSVAACKWIADA